MKKPPKIWYMYVLLCRGNTYYCGITTNVERRVAEHQNGQGSKYVRSRLPVNLVFISEEIAGQGKAARFEAKFKKLSRKQKDEFLKMDGGMCNRFLILDIFGKERVEGLHKTLSGIRDRYRKELNIC